MATKSKGNKSSSSSKRRSINGRRPKTVKNWSDLGCQISKNTFYDKKPYVCPDNAARWLHFSHAMMKSRRLCDCSSINIWVFNKNGLLGNLIPQIATFLEGFVESIGKLAFDFRFLVSVCRWFPVAGSRWSVVGVVVPMGYSVVGRIGSGGRYVCMHLCIYVCM